MSNEVIFEEPGADTVSTISIVQAAPTGIVAWLVKNKAVQNAKQGERVLLVVGIVAVILAIGIYVLFGMRHPHALPYVLGIPSRNGTLAPVPGK